MRRFLKYIYLLILVIVICGIVAAAYFGIASAPYIPQGYDTLHETDSLPKVIAHKSKLNPEAVGDSVEDLYRIMNSQIPALEVDVRLTRDNIPVIFYADDVVENKTLQELKGILTLEQVFQIVQDKKTIFLDVKNSQIFSNDMSIAIAKLIDKYNLADIVVVESFNPFFLYKYRKIAPHNLIMYDFLYQAVPNAQETHEHLARIPWLIKQKFFQNWVRWILKPDILGPKENFPIAEIREFRNAGFPIIVWTVDDPKQAAMLFSNGINGLQTNVPLEMLDIPQQYAKIYDASRTSKAMNVDIIQVRSEADIAEAIQKAGHEKRGISAFGRRHSQGGQSFANSNILLNMLDYNSMQLLADGSTLRVQTGATWRQVQTYLNPLGRSVKIMQSDNIFSTGGSASVNVHGWQVSSGPLSSSVVQFKLLLADGTSRTCSNYENVELFRAALGGYGLIGIITEIDLETVPNYNLRSKKFVIKPEDYVAKYTAEVTEQPLAQLAYGRLNVTDSNMFDEAFLHVFYRDPQGSVSTSPIDNESLIAMKRQIFRASERSELGKKVRWELETKVVTVLESAHLTRNFVMSPDIQTLWPLSLENVDILHEYFIPKDKFINFLDILKILVKKHAMNLLNVTIREVLQDKITLLAFAKQDVFAFVLFFSQPHSEQGENAMHAFTEELVGEVLKLNGSFYLPYRPHYTKQQLFAAYPQLPEFLQLKQQYDPQKIFINSMYLHYLN